MSNGVTHPLQGVTTRRKMMGVAAKDVAAALNMQVQSFYRLERGERVCPLPKAITLARVLDCTVEELGQEPSIDAQVAAVRAHYAAETAKKLASLQFSQPQPEGLPIKDAHGHIVGHQVRSSGSVVNVAQPTHTPVTDDDPELAALIARLTSDDEPENVP